LLVSSNEHNLIKTIVELIYVSPEKTAVHQQFFHFGPRTFFSFFRSKEKGDFLVFDFFGARIRIFLRIFPALKLLLTSAIELRFTMLRKKKKTAILFDQLVVAVTTKRQIS
jgi:hypothetical protein